MYASLRILSPDDGMDIYAMLQTQPADENGFINGAYGLPPEEFPAWLQRQHDMAAGIGLEDWMVPQTTCWFMLNGQCVGYGKYRHRLTEALRQSGGNMGYCIFPEFRGNGYGKTFARLLVQQMRRAGIGEILITVHRDNPASIRVAEACGAVKTGENDKRVYLTIP